MYSATLYHMQGNRHKIREGTLVWSCTKISRNIYEGKVTHHGIKQLKTDRAIPNNKLDITICNNTKQSCLLIETALSGDKKCEPERSLEDFKI